MTVKTISQSAEPANAPLSREPNKPHRVLVVEDDVAVRRVNTEILTYSGFQVDAAEDGAAAWDALQQNKYDLVVTDNDMPKVTGVELIQKLREASMSLPVIMATGAPPEELFTRCGMPPPARILIKPYTLNELLTAVKEVLHAASDSLGKIQPSATRALQSPCDRPRQ
jgi:DNA-binding response OmpR family regulator